MFLFFFKILVYGVFVVLFFLFACLPVCFPKKGKGFGIAWMGGSGRRSGGGSHDQNILYEIFSFNKQNRTKWRGEGRITEGNGVNMIRVLLYMHASANHYFVQ